MVSLAAAQEAIELAEASGLYLEESQQISLRAGMGERDDGKWAAFEMVDIGPRQSTGKNDTVSIREMHEMFVLGSRLVIHTAHESKTADESFIRMEELIGNNSELRAQVIRFRYGNGDHAVELRSGARMLYKTRTGGAARGFAGATLLVYDEALFLQAKHVQASLAVLARGKTAAHNPQVWSLSSAALESSTYMHEARRQAFVGNGNAMRCDGAGSAGRFAYSEHTAEVLSLVDNRIVTNRGMVDLDDRGLWAVANPAMNHPVHGISEEFIENERRFQQFDLDGWARERLGFFDPAPDERSALMAKLPADRWVATVRPNPVKPVAGACTLAYDVSVDGEWASIVLGWGSLGEPHVQQLEHRQGVGWLPARLVELVKEWQPVALGCNGAGPAGAQVGPVMLALSVEGVRTELQQLGAVSYRQACGGFFTDVVEGRLIRPPVLQGPLDLAAADATDRRLGDAWAWDIRNATVPISPLVAATVARALLPVAVVKPPAPKPVVHSF